MISILTSDTCIFSMHINSKHKLLQDVLLFSLFKVSLFELKISNPKIFGSNYLAALTLPC